jgi:hypothetical protein
MIAAYFNKEFLATAANFPKHALARLVPRPVVVLTCKRTVQNGTKIASYLIELIVKDSMTETV